MGLFIERKRLKVDIRSSRGKESRGKRQKGREKNKTELGTYRNRFFVKLTKFRRKFHSTRRNRELWVIEEGKRWKENLDRKLFYSISGET